MRLGRDWRECDNWRHHQGRTPEWEELGKDKREIQCRTLSQFQDVKIEIVTSLNLASHLQMFKLWSLMEQ